MGKFYILVDFMVLEMDEDPNVTIILGRSFLATAEAIIGVKNDNLILKVGDDKIEFNLSQIMKCYPFTDECFKVETIDYDVPQFMHVYDNDPLTLPLVDDCRSDEVKSIVKLFDSTPTLDPFEEMFLAIGEEEPKVSKSNTKAPKVKLNIYI